ncbi:hypothetical protein K466DRAFT_524428, partial [Polyporus arcularius HHB13444]
MRAILDLLSHPLISSLLSLHPNSLALYSFVCPEEWTSWFNWAATDTLKFSNSSKQCERPSNLETTDPQWLILLRYYEACRRGDKPCGSCDAFQTIPDDVREVIEGLSGRSLPRDVGHSFPTSPDSTYLSPSRPSLSHISLPGMSPKKAHEVVEMTAFLKELLLSHASLGDTRYAVDIGAGQAYLSRNLRDSLGLHVLALDWSDVQTQGAARKDASAGKSSRKSRSKDQINAGDSETPSPGKRSSHRTAASGSLTYVTTRIDKESLLASIEAWLGEAAPPGFQSSAELEPSQEAVPRPVLMVALHACGSLTPDILRAFFAAAARSHRQTEVSADRQEHVTWTPQGAVIVGCCYNMMRPEDFPLSRAFMSCRGAEGFRLTANHLQLAAQVPAEWTRTEETVEAARFALRKVVWRAALEETLQKHGGAAAHETGDPHTQGTQQDRLPRRLGRLNDSAYRDWETFVRTVRAKMGLADVDIPAPNPEMERRIEVFQTLRCIAGPAVESLILLDRLAWIQEELEGLPYKVELVNLFDQASGSGRNVAIVIRP